MADGKKQISTFRKGLGFSSLCLTIWAVTSYCFWLWNVAFKNVRSFEEFYEVFGKPISWAPLEIEKGFYEAHNYYLGWLQWKPLVEIRDYVEPFFAFWDLSLIRIYGLLATGPLYLLIVFVGLSEGRVRYNEKETSFGNRSAWRFHVLFRSLAALIPFILLFTFIPFGDDTLGFEIPISLDLSLPLIGTFQFWVSNPMNMFWLTSLWLGYAMYELASNFDRNM